MGIARTRRGRWAALLGCACVLANAAAAAPASLRVGRLTLWLCETDYNGYCGEMERALDPSGKLPGTISVGFEYYPHTDRSLSSLGTILPQEGGPGYSSTGTRAFYLSLFDSLRSRRDVLIVDKRGTGRSEPIDCPEAQTGAKNLDAVAACAKQLGPAAWYYGTDYAVNDLIGVLDALDIDVVDFYGDSYGTFVGQVFAALHPERLRSLILDSAYPVRAPDAWFASDWAAAWSGIDVTCARSPSCRTLGGAATSRVTRLIDEVREHPIKGVAPDINGDLVPATVDASALINLIDSAGSGPLIYRDLDAASRAWLDAKDPLPVLRLVSEQSTPSPSEPVDFSEGLYTAVICSDYPLLYDLREPRALRNRQYARAVEEAAENRAALFAPFTLDEGIDSQVYITPLDSCLPWRAPPADLAPGAAGAPLPAHAQFPAVPTLILSGDLDSITSVADANETAAQFPNVVHVVVPNLGHVVANGDDLGCTLGIVERFIKNLSPGSIGCVDDVRPVRSVPRFALNAAELAPVEATVGNRASAAQRRIAAAGLEAVGDVLARYYVTAGYVGGGLRGGNFTYAPTAAGYDFALHDIRWTSDVRVSGTIAWDQTNSDITAHVTLQSGSAALGALDIRWNNAQINAVASITGKIQGALLHARRIAP